LNSRIIVSALAAAVLPLSVQAGEALELGDAWVRALPPTQPNTAAYLRVHNRGPEPLVVVGGSADVAERVEIHTTREIDGMVRMQRLPQLSVPAGGSVALAPGGVHLMLLDLVHMPAPGQEVRLCLELASGEQACTVATASKDGDGDAVDHSHHHH
jgi:copper(I)-binding protein